MIFGVGESTISYHGSLLGNRIHGDMNITGAHQGVAGFGVHESGVEGDVHIPVVIAVLGQFHEQVNLAKVRLVDGLFGSQGVGGGAIGLLLFRYGEQFLGKYQARIAQHAFHNNLGDLFIVRY